MVNDQMDYLSLNRKAWNRRTEVHFESGFYDVPGFLAGKSSLTEIERNALGDVSGKRMLHLQCHFGMDTLSWARLGAVCTGVDLSPVAIEKANLLKSQAGLQADFICADVYSYARGSCDPFDIVFTSYGAVCWLPDLDRWARVISSNLAAGGTFYMAEFHPVYDLVDGYAYFGSSEPDVEEEGTYTENGSDAITTLAIWTHPVSRVVNALISAGIEIQRFEEYPFSPYNCFKGMQERQAGRFYYDLGGQDIPLVYSITGRKVA